VPYLSVSAVVIHYEVALYQVYAPLPLPLHVVLTGSNGHRLSWTPPGRPASYPRLATASRLSPRRLTGSLVAVAMRPSIGYRRPVTGAAPEYPSSSSSQQQQQQQQQR